MTTDDNTNPTPEMLAAYMDGELTPSERNAMEGRLTSNPEMDGELEAHRGLGRLLQRTSPNDPGEDTWAMTLAGISDRLAVPKVNHPRRRFPLRWLAGIAAAAAAITLSWILSSKSRRPDAPPAPDPQDEIAETLSAASSDDIVITSLSGAQDELVLVGRPPVQNVEPAGPGEVVMEERAPVKNVNMEFTDEPGVSPMIIMQQEKAVEKQQDKAIEK